MTAHNIEIIIEGLDEENGDADFEEFLSQLSSLKNVLKKTEKELSHGKSKTHYRVVDLTHSSPARIVLSAHINPKDIDYRNDVLTKVAYGLEMLQRGESPNDISIEVLEDLKKIADKVGKKVKSTTINVCKKTFDFSEKIAQTIETSLSSTESCITSYEGSLDQINIHSDTKIFYIYPVSGPSKIKCNFKEELFDKAIDAIGKKVLVEGVAKYRALTAFPHEISVNEIEIYQPDDELPTFEDLRGIIPNATGSKLSEEYIADLRDEWI